MRQNREADRQRTMIAAAIALRAAEPQDFAFCERLYFEGMAAIIDALKLDSARQHDGLVRQWRVSQVSIITVGGEDAGWLQTERSLDAIFLAQLYIAERFQRRGIGSAVITRLIDDAMRAGKAVTLGVVKINPALRLYERLGFRRTHEDQHKFYLQLAPSSSTLPPE
jgi:ribosomal protein S18 acetylase RimI-like enzyme